MIDPVAVRLAQMRERSEAATSAPWTRATKEFRGSLGHSVKSAPSGMVVAFGGYGPEGGGSWADAEFIAHARVDLVDLLGAVEDVLALHVPVTHDPDTGWVGEPFTECRVCCWTYPCPTARAITKRLGTTNPHHALQVHDDGATNGGA